MNTSVDSNDTTQTQSDENSEKIERNEGEIREGRQYGFDLGSKKFHLYIILDCVASLVHLSLECCSN